MGLVTQVPEEHGENQLGAADVLALRVRRVDAEEDLGSASTHSDNNNDNVEGEIE